MKVSGKGKKTKKSKKAVLHFLNLSKRKMPKSFLSLWIESLKREFRVHGLRKWALIQEKDLSLVFLDEPAMLLLNSTFRKKKKATDVLSFPGPNPDFFGEVVLCPHVIVKRKSKAFKNLSEEYAYLILHALLHLMGFSHERSKKKEQEMFTLQDKIFFKNIESIKMKFQRTKKKKKRL